MDLAVSAVWYSAQQWPETILKSWQSTIRANWLFGIYTEIRHRTRAFQRNDRDQRRWIVCRWTPHSRNFQPRTGRFEVGRSRSRLCRRSNRSLPYPWKAEAHLRCRCKTCRYVGNPLKTIHLLFVMGVNHQTYDGKRNRFQCFLYNQLSGPIDQRSSMNISVS